MRAAKALASMRICADLSEPSLLADMLSTEIYCTGHWGINCDMYFSLFQFYHLQVWENGGFVAIDSEQDSRTVYLCQIHISL